MPGPDASAVVMSRSSPLRLPSSSSCSTSFNRSYILPTVNGAMLPLSPALNHVHEMRLGRAGGPLPREGLGEHPCLAAESRNKVARFGEPPERRGERRDVAVRHQESGLAVAHRLANAGRVRRHD